MESVGEILIRADQIAARVRELVAAMAPRYAGRTPVFVGIMEGCRPFAESVARQWPEPAAIECVSARSYDGTVAGRLTVTLPPDLAARVAGRPVLLIDDIYDSGRTLAAVKRKITACHPEEIRTLVLLRKRHPTGRCVQGGRSRKVVVAAAPDWVGFEVEDRFVIGYGLDFRGRYRDLPYIAVLEEQP
jgi:hypoxanthine phosphoribosyltransferase